MNRPIKFRGKSIFDEEWLYGDLVLSSDMMRYAILVNDKNCYDECEVIPSTIGQFTGLYDKNGKEIYEGDILQADRFNASLCVVSWSTERATFAYRFYYKKIDDTHEIDRKTSCEYTIGDWMKIEKDLAIIGNIYDNPDLMKGFTIHLK